MTNTYFIFVLIFAKVIDKADFFHFSFILAFLFQLIGYFFNG